MTTPSAVSEERLRERAVRRLKKRSDFYGHLLIFVLVNGFVVAIWALTSGGFFWPVFLIAAWGIGLIANAWDVYRSDPLSENRIQSEMHRLREQ